MFVDFRKAFDSVDHGKLFPKLHDIGISSKLINILYSFYSKAVACIRAGNERTEAIRICMGVLQGEILSPTLFSLFLHDIECYLREQGCRGLSLNSLIDILLLAYADDIVLLADTPVE